MAVQESVQAESLLMVPLASTAEKHCEQCLATNTTLDMQLMHWRFERNMPLESYFFEQDSAHERLTNSKRAVRFFPILSDCTVAVSIWSISWSGIES